MPILKCEKCVLINYALICPVHLTRSINHLMVLNVLADAGCTDDELECSYLTNSVLAKIKVNTYNVNAMTLYHSSLRGCRGILTISR